MQRLIRLKSSFLYLLAGCLCAQTTTLCAQENIFVQSELQKLIDVYKMRTAIVMSVEDDTTGLITLGEISDENRALPDNNSTLFEIGSITKVFTALLVQTLVDEGLLNWDDSLATLLPEVEFVNEDVAKVTLRELATHRSGLPRLPTNFTDTDIPGDPMDPYATYNANDLVSFLQSFDPKELIKVYAYSNVGFAILGYLGAEILNVSYAKALHERIFKPLGMTHTTASKEFHENTELAAGYSNTANMGVWNFNVHESAGAIRSTAQDMVRFIRANLVESDNAIHRSIRAIRELQYDSNHALGWITETSNQESTVYLHSGQTGGYASFLAIDPQNQRGWVILTTSNESAALVHLGSSFYKDVVHPDTIDLTPYTGVFRLGRNQYMTFTNKDGQLQAQVSGQPGFLLQHTGDHQFSLEAVSWSALFHVAENGIASKMTWTQPEIQAPIDAERVDDSYGVSVRKEVTLDGETLQQYAGTYRLHQTALVTVRTLTDRIFVQVAGQPEFRVFPMSPTRFFYRAIDAEIEFERTEDGTVTELVLHQVGEHRAPRVETDD